MSYRLLTIGIILLSFCTYAKQVNIADQGADPSGKIPAHKIIQQAIDQCNVEGGGTVVIPAGTFLSGTLVLKDNVELHLERGATLLGSDVQQHYPRQKQPEYRSLYDTGGWYALIYAEGAENIAITGNGTIDGQGSKQQPRPGALDGGRDGRPRNILLISCKNIKIRDITLRNSGVWNQHYLNCEDVLIEGVKVYNHSNRNNDGIDIDGCRRLIMTNCIIDSDDDAICLKSTGISPCEDIIISNCIASSFCNGIKMGTESTGGFRNINISNCIVKPSLNPEEPGGNKYSIGITGLSLEIVDGGIMEGISVNNLTIEGTMCPVYVRLGGRSRKHIEEAMEPAIGIMRNITLSNITAYGSGNFACSVTGIPGHRVENVRLNNFNIVQQGGLKEGDYLPDLASVIEDIKGYPQPTSWHNLPCAALFMRHVEGISITNFSFDATNEDPRPLFYADDVKNLSIQKVYAGKNVQNPSLEKFNVEKIEIDF